MGSEAQIKHPSPGLKTGAEDVEGYRCDVHPIEGIPMRFYAIDLTSEVHSTNVSFARIQADNADNADKAQEIALSLMAKPAEWRVIGIDQI
ncbi:hypothetical protein [Pseudomonas syringae]|uniref:hypothetical protein n=1 Tax=Pseudomonas syringae TaxID=317 RepID=UPI002466657B|nr:hypothetical protein [Pseudomonas syringae]MDH4602321.1 hypothetical protein [Pseudomonas syringae pv. papulans]